MRCNFICGLSDVIIKTFCQSFSYSVSQSSYVSNFRINNVEASQQQSPCTRSPRIWHRVLMMYPVEFAPLGCQQ